MDWLFASIASSPVSVHLPCQGPYRVGRQPNGAHGLTRPASSPVAVVTHYQRSVDARRWEGTGRPEQAGHRCTRRGAQQALNSDSYALNQLAWFTNWMGFQLRAFHPARLQPRGPTHLGIDPAELPKY
jgi:hypothetical protein